MHKTPATLHAPLPYQRHDLLFFNSRAHRSCILAGAQPTPPGAPQEYADELLGWAGTRIPAIVRRQETSQQGCIDIGLSSPRRWQGVRYRIGASLPVCDVVQVRTPFAVMAEALKAHASADAQVLAALHVLAQACGVCAIGLYGSHALQAVSGLTYTTRESDYDVLLQGSMQALHDFSARLVELELRYAVKVDAEARLLVGAEHAVCDVKLVELVSGSQWVLAKTRSSVELLERKVLFATHSGG